MRGFRFKAQNQAVGRRKAESRGNIQAVKNRAKKRPKKSRFESLPPCPLWTNRNKGAGWSHKHSRNSQKSYHFFSLFLEKISKF
jgi:hypothetical protein